MARTATTTPAPAGANTPARRRFLTGAIAALTGAGFSAVVLSPDPTWGNPPEGRAGTALTNPDAELIRLCSEDVAGSARFDAITAEWAEVMEEPPEVQAEVRLLVDQGHALREAIAGLPAHTLAGVRAKAASIRGHWGPDAPGMDAWVADSMVDDLLRLLPVGSDAA